MAVIQVFKDHTVTCLRSGTRTPIDRCLTCKYSGGDISENRTICHVRRRDQDLDEAIYNRATSKLEKTNQDKTKAEETKHKPKMEIERKFLLTKPVPKHFLPLCTIKMEQSYLSTTPEVRIRKEETLRPSINVDTNLNPHIPRRQSTTAYVVCFKGTGDLARSEIEVVVMKDTYEDLLSLTINDPIIKEHTKYIVGDAITAENYLNHINPQSSKIQDKYQNSKYNGRQIEVNLVGLGRDSSFSYIEVEFTSEEEAKSYIPLDWFGPEITYDKEYKMKNYWQRTRFPETKQRNGSEAITSV